MQKPPLAAKPRSRRLLYILLGGSWAALIVAIFVSFSALTTATRQRDIDDLALRLMQSRLERRLGQLEESGVTERASVEAKLKDISVRQEAASASAAARLAQAPFPIDGVMGAVVQVVCIDNDDKETYYSGSGTVIDGAGLVLTNRHLLVSKRGSVIKYCGIGFTQDLKEPPTLDFVATVLVAQAQDDLALLRITERVDRKTMPLVFPSLSFEGAAAAAAGLRLGDVVYIAGYPDVGADTFTFTEGVVSGRLGPNFIKTSALVDTGASGGAGLDGSGRFIGVPTAAAKGEIGGSLGYLISAEIVDGFLTRYFSRQK